MLSVDQKRRKLEKLRKMIERVWFYPEYEGVMGYYGTGPIMFVGLNPSTGIFPSKADEFLYKQLKKHRIKNSHITDLVKKRMANKEAEEYFEKHPKNQIKLLKEEIKVIRPKIVVAFGRKCHKHLKKAKIENLALIMHYTHPFNRGRKHKTKNKNKFCRQLKEIKRNCMNRRCANE